MSFYQNKGFWIAFTIFSPLLLLGINSGVKVMTSVYKTDFGNGVVIYADDYVKSGRWVFDCEYSRLISREPLPVPVGELEQLSQLSIGDMYSLNANDKKLAETVIRAFISTPNWYKGLRYLYSSLDEYSNLNTHVFDLQTKHAEWQWALRVRQNININNNGKSRFTITAEPYDPETYVDYTKALQAAAKSCPIPQ